MPTASPVIRDLIEKLVSLNPADRPSAIECVNILEGIPRNREKIEYEPLSASTKQSELLSEIAFASELEMDLLISNLHELAST